MKAEKQNATSNACRRLSLEIDAMELLTISNCPDSTIRLYMKTAVRMIHPMGNSPLATPSAAAEMATLTGIP